MLAHGFILLILNLQKMSQEKDKNFITFYNNDFVTILNIKII